MRQISRIKIIILPIVLAWSCAFIFLPASLAATTKRIPVSAMEKPPAVDTGPPGSSQDESLQIMTTIKLPATITTIKLPDLCIVSLLETSTMFDAPGGTGTVNIDINMNGASFCAWDAVSNNDWIIITSGSNYTHETQVNFTVAANTSTASRTGTMTIAQQTFTVYQSGAAPAASSTTTSDPINTTTVSSTSTVQATSTIQVTTTVQATSTVPASSSTSTSTVNNATTTIANPTTTTIDELKADFSVSNGVGSVPFEVSFFNTSTGNATRSEWAFGDGATSTEREPVHTYTQMGNFTVSLTVYDAAGASDRKVKPNAVYVLPPCPFISTLEDNEQIMIFKNLREVLFKSQAGMVAAILYYKNADEISELIRERPDMQVKFKQLAAENAEAANDLIAGRNTTIAYDRALNVIDFLNQMQLLGSRKLQNDIDLVLLLINNGYLLNGLGIEIE